MAGLRGAQGKPGTNAELFEGRSIVDRSAFAGRSIGGRMPSCDRIRQGHLRLAQAAIDRVVGADPYSVLRIYAGALPWVPVPSLSIQCKTTATTLADGWTQANALFGSLLDGGLRSVRMLSVPAVNGGPNYRLNGADPRPPALLGRDERGRGEIVFNFSAEIVKLS